MDWASVAVALAALAGGSLFARQRARFRPADLSNERTERVWHAAALFAVAVNLAAAIEAAILPAPGVLVALVPTVFVDGAVMLVLAILIDLLVVRPLDAVRSRGWLVAAPALFAFAYVGLVMTPLIFWRLVPLPPLLSLNTLAVAGDAAAAGLIWWAYLPLPEEPDVAGLFE